jgi:multidrug efflux pump subunit AcrB
MQGKLSHSKKEIVVVKSFLKVKNGKLSLDRCFQQKEKEKTPKNANLQATHLRFRRVFPAHNAEAA